MKPENKILLAVGVTIASLVIALYAISSTIVMGGFSRVEDDNVRQNVGRAVDALSDDIAELNRTTNNWATWDETYAFVEDNNSNYINSYLYNDEFGILRVNIIFLINSSGEVAFGKSVDLDTLKEKSFTINTYGLLSRNMGTNGNFSGIILLPEGPMLIAGRPILTSNATGPSRGTLVMGRFLTPEEVNNLGDETHLSLTVSEFNASRMPPDFMAVRSLFGDENHIIVKPVNASIAGYSIVRDIYGNPALMLRVDMPRSIYQQGRNSLNYYLFSLIAIGLVFGGEQVGY